MPLRSPRRPAPGATAPAAPAPSARSPVARRSRSARSRQGFQAPRFAHWHAPQLRPTSSPLPGSCRRRGRRRASRCHRRPATPTASPRWSSPRAEHPTPHLPLPPRQARRARTASPTLHRRVAQRPLLQRIRRAAPRCTRRGPRASVLPPSRRTSRHRGLKARRDKEAPRLRREPVELEQLRLVGQRHREAAR